MRAYLADFFAFLLGATSPRAADFDPVVLLTLERIDRPISQTAVALDQARAALATALGVYVDDALGSLEVDL